VAGKCCFSDKQFFVLLNRIWRRWHEVLEQVGVAKCQFNSRAR
jgi:hypothetical protein